jgi:succinylglutamic semialdehyde dehydrogenase
MSGQLFIDGVWRDGAGAAASSFDPATGETVWRGATAWKGDVAQAVAAARRALPAWADQPRAARAAALRRYQSALERRAPAFAEALSRETGKALWETKAELGSMRAKVDASLKAYDERTGESHLPTAFGQAVLRHRPHGVMAVLGPFNFPGHLPNGHIVPALLAGDTVVFKPSEETPLAGQMLVEALEEADLPPGVVNLVQGGRDTGAALIAEAIDGLLFTGSASAGAYFRRIFADRPDVILALELGGNNPLVVWDCADAEASAYLAAQSAYITAGQRCVCARRLILPQGAEGDRHLAALQALLPRLRVGAPSEVPEPFLGPVISPAAADRMLEAQAAMEKAGGRILMPMRKVARGALTEKNSPFLTPGLVDMSEAREKPDEEFFGPLLQVIRVGSFDAALEEANRTRYGLAAGLVSDKRALWEIFRERIRAGVVNWNRQTTGASGKLPFGGVGDSGNHRPSAFYAADYCAFPMASLEADRAVAPEKPPVGIDAKA